MIYHRKCTVLIVTLVALVCFNCKIICQVHEVRFCGERIPVSQKHVSARLMDVIRQQIPYVNLPQLRKRAQLYMPGIESYLRLFGLPDDLKYLAIVESGFTTGTSGAGARGAWQLMPNTAREKGLLVNELTDDRDDLDKSTRAACYLLAEYFIAIQKRFQVSSWVLTAAAYNVGIGNLQNTILKQGSDYFNMQLNAETALYVYKIIAVKELFEYPEFYLRYFDNNVFAISAKTAEVLPVKQDSAFKRIEVIVDSEMPGTITQPAYKVVGAVIKGKYNSFADRQLIKIKLLETFEHKGMFRSKGSILQGTGWLINGKVFVDLGFSEHEVQVFDKAGISGFANQGIALRLLKDKEPILLRVLQE